jgi:hypothetical protein
VVILQEAYCQGKLPPWALVQGLEKCRFGMEHLSTAEYIELSTLQDETVVKSGITLEKFDQWVDMNNRFHGMNQTTPKPTTSAAKSVKTGKGLKKTAKKTTKDRPQNKRKQSTSTVPSISTTHPPLLHTTTTTTTSLHPATITTHTIVSNDEEEEEPEELTTTG